MFGAIVAVVAAARSPMMNSGRRRHLEMMEQAGRAQSAAGVQELYFTQTLDHYNALDPRTWQQRYFISDAYFNNVTGGPLFLQVGGEGAISAFYVTGLMMTKYAAIFGALQIGLEHRFYGKSQPLPDLSLPGLKYLTSQQALFDAAVFVRWVRTQYPSITAVVAFGGSYPGALAAWVREKFPFQIHASVASSAPVLAVVDMVQYLDVCGVSLDALGGEGCEEAVTQAFSELDTMMATAAGAAQVSQMFNACTPVPADSDAWLDRANFLTTVIGWFQGVVQYNAEQPGQPTIPTICATMTGGAGTPLARLASLGPILNAGMCVDVKYSDMVAQLNDTSQAAAGVGERQWTYQTCGEFGYFQTTDDVAGQPFGTGLPLAYYTQLCADVFGIQALPRVNDTNAFYGGQQPVGLSNVLFVNGNIDPWHALSITSPLSPSVPAILINGTAHCANMFPAQPGDPPGLEAAQRATAALIGEWLLSS